MATRKQRAIVYRRAANPAQVPLLLEQLAVCSAYIKERGWSLNRTTGIVDDFGLPSRDLPGLASLLHSDLRAMVVVSSLDRLGATAQDIAVAIECITDDGDTEVHSIRESFCSSEHAEIVNALALAGDRAMDHRTADERAEDEDWTQHQMFQSACEVGIVQGIEPVHAGVVRLLNPERRRRRPPPV